MSLCAMWRQCDVAVIFMGMIWIGCRINKVRLCLCLWCGDSVMWL